jgi:hypothetical protein
MVPIFPAKICFVIAYTYASISYAELTATSIPSLLRPLPVLELNPFRANQDKLFSWDDPLLHHELWEGATEVSQKPRKREGRQVITYSLRKRADPAPTLYTSPACSCPSKGVRGGKFPLTDITYLLSKIKHQTAGSSCVFYAQRPLGSDPHGWSVPATEWACESPATRYSLWVSIVNYYEMIQQLKQLAHKLTL